MLTSDGVFDIEEKNHLIPCRLKLILINQLRTPPYQVILMQS